MYVVHRTEEVMKFKEGVPIYLQLTQDIANKILAGHYLAGQRIESVREMALIYGVNPNTVQKSLTLAEQQGLVFAQGAEGRFVTKDESYIELLKQQTIEREVYEFVSNMKQLGFNKHQIIKELQKGGQSDEH